MVRQAFDHILRFLLILRFHRPQYPSMEHLAFRRDQAAISNFVDQGVRELQLKRCRVGRFIEELGGLEFRQQFSQFHLGEVDDVAQQRDRNLRSDHRDYLQQ